MQIKRRGAAPPKGSPDGRVFWLSVRIGAKRVRCSLRTGDHRVAMERALARAMDALEEALFAAAHIRQQPIDDTTVDRPVVPLERKSS